MTQSTLTKRVADAAAGTALVAGVYVRISEDRESDELGVGRQDEDSRKLAAEQGLPVLRSYSDDDRGASTRSRKPRPEFDRLVTDVRAGRVNVIIAYSSSRLTRRPLELEELIKLAETYGVRYLYVKSPTFDLNTADGRMVARILAAADAAEAERIGERVSRAAKQRAEAGRYHGGSVRPFGFAADGLTVIDAEAEVIRDLVKRVLSASFGQPKGDSLRQMARDLRADGVASVTGRPWSPGTVKDLLTRPRNAGLMVHKGQIALDAQGKEITAPWGALVDPDQWRTAVAKLTDPGRATVAPGAPLRYLLSGIVQCPCGSVCDVHGGTGRARRYKCKGKAVVGGGGHVTRDTVALDRYVADLVVERLSRPDALSLFAPATGDGTDIPALRAEAKRLRGKLADLAALFAADAIDRGQLTSGTATLRGKVAAIEAELSAAVSVDPVADIAGADNVAELWESYPLGRQRAIVHRLMSVRILPAGRGKGFDPRYVEVTWK